MPALEQHLPDRHVAGADGAPAWIRPELAHKGGFRTLEKEISAWLPDSAIKGRLPADLAGTLYRNGPARNERGGEAFGHWFDGDGMVHGFTLRDGRVHYQNRYVQTRKFRRESAAGRITERSFGTNRPGGVLANMGRMIANTANTSVCWHGGRLLACYEAGLPHALDPVTLDTLGCCDFHGRLRGYQTFSAHGKEDPRTGRFYNFGMTMGLRGMCMDLYRTGPDGRMEAQNRVDIGPHPFVHDFAMTENYLVFFVGPLRFSAIMEFSMGLCTFDEAMRWDASRGCEVVVVRKSDLRIARRIRTDPMLVIHFGNAWEEGDRLQIDLYHFDEFVVADFLRDIFHAKNRFDGFHSRYTVDLRRNGVSGRRLSDVAAEFPAWDRRRTGKKTRFLYSAALRHGPTEGFFNGLVRHDSETGSEQVLDLGEGRFTSEPIFAPRRGSRAETDGYLLAVVFDAYRQASELLILDARNLQQHVATVYLDHHVPFGFHGTWVERTFL